MGRHARWVITRSFAPPMGRGAIAARATRRSNARSAARSSSSRGTGAIAAANDDEAPVGVDGDDGLEVGLLGREPATPPRRFARPSSSRARNSPAASSTPRAAAAALVELRW